MANINATLAPTPAQDSIQPLLFEQERSFPDPDPALVARALRAAYIAVDVETQTEAKFCNPAVPAKDFGLSHTAPITVLACAWSENGAIQSLTFHAPFSPEALEFIKALLLPERTIIAHNAIFDLRQLSKHGGIAFDSVWCTQVMARLITPNLSEYNLLAVAHYYGIEVPAWVKDVKAQRSRLHTLPAAQVLEYVTLDAVLAYQIYEKQIIAVDSEELALLVQWEQAAITEYCRMAGRGLKLSETVPARITELIKLRQQLWRELVDDGCTNPGSSQACIRYIYQIKQVPLPAWYAGSPLFTDKGHMRLGGSAEDKRIVELGDLSADKEALTELMLDEQIQPVIRKLKDFKEVEYTCRTLEALVDHAALDGRVHSMVNVATVTGRRASSHPNIQNLKFGGESVAGDFSGVFVGDEGYTLVEIDYSNAENWIAALISGDNALARACSAEDFHSAMAEKYFGQRWHDADAKHRKMLRRDGKSITFGAAYGLQAKMLSIKMKISYDEARNLLRNRELAFPDVADTFKAAQSKAESDGYVNLWTGRPLPVNHWATYTAFNYTCQGGVGEMIKRSIVLIMQTYKEYGMHSYVAHDMHDALILAVKHDEWERALNAASLIMQTVIPDELNERTDPPIRWLAEPDVKGNAEKWGKGQWHPESNLQWFADEDGNVFGLNEKEVAELILRPEYGPFESESEAQVFCAQKVEVPTLPVEAATEQPEIIFKVDSLGFEWRGKVRLRPEIRFNDWSPDERKEAARFFCDYIGHVDGMLKTVYQVYLPAKLADGSVGMAEKPTGVDMVNWAKIPLLWARVAQQGVDTVALIEMSEQELIQAAAERQAQVESIQRLADTLIEYIARLPSEQYFTETGEVEF